MDKNFNLPNGIQKNNGKIAKVSDKDGKIIEVSCSDTYWLSIQGAGIETQSFWGDYWHTEKGEKVRLFPRVFGETLEEVISRLQEAIIDNLDEKE